MKPCVVCGYDARVTMIMPVKTELEILRDFGLKDFCLPCMASIAEAYKKLSEGESK